MSRDKARDKDLDDAKKRRQEKKDAFDASVRRAHESGMSNVEIAEALGVTTQTIRDALTRMGVRPNVEALFIGPKPKRSSSGRRVSGGTRKVGT
jgi:DNA-binding NarL/FixJ family response regulator